MAVKRYAFCIMVLLVQVTFSFDFDHIIYIDVITGEDSEECLTNNDPSSPCRTLNWVFQPQHHSNSIHYVLSEGTHSLTEPITPFQDLTSLAFTGTGSVVTCTHTDIGLAFINVVNITFYDITFQNCSAVRNSTSRRFDCNEKRDFDLYQFLVGLYFFQCCDIAMTSLIVSDTSCGTAVVMYNTNGSIVIKDSTFTRNQFDSDSVYPGGGGFYVEFSYCIPGDDTCTNFKDSVTEFNRNGSYRFQNTTFSNNKASNLQDYKVQETYIIPYKRIQNVFGKGGGIAVIFKGNASDNNFVFLDCTFEGNEAVWGGGMLIEYQDHSWNNSVSIYNSIFSGNHAPSGPDMETAGGGIRIGNYVYNTVNQPRNSLIIDGCELSDNHALNGGGISFFPVRQITQSKDQLFKFTVTNTTVTHNQARIGAAMEFTLFSLFVTGDLSPVTVDLSKFISNSIYDNDSMINQEGVGGVYTNGVPILFKNEIQFFRNRGSALAVVGTLVNFSNSNATFIENSGKYGGAINLLGSAFILINNVTSMVFERNSAEVFGGAIANVYIERENFKAYSNCFIRYVIPFLHPNEWEAQFQFIDNTARLLGQSIHTTSINPCTWAGGSGRTRHEDILCWKGWSYRRNDSFSNCSDEINTNSGSMKFSSVAHYNHSNIETTDYEDSNMTKIIHVIPGKVFRLPLSIQDDLGKDVSNQTVFSAISLNPHESQVDPTYTFVSGEQIKVNGIGNNTVGLQLYTNSERAWNVELKIKLKKCPPGLVSSDNPPINSSYCTCDSNDYQGKISCNTDLKEAYITNGYWFGITPESEGKLVVSLCLPGFCQREVVGNKKRIPDSVEKLEEELCGGKHFRKGILCGECQEGYGPSVNTEDYRCIMCNDTTLTKYVILEYMASVYIPLLALFVFIIVFSIRLTSGPANAFIFYAQIISSTFDLNADSHIPLNLITNHSEHLLWAYRFPYGIFNLEFAENLIKPLCIKENMNALDVLELDYAIAFFPLLMIFVVIILVKIKDTYQCSFKRSKWKFLHNWKSGESLLHAFSAFLLLSYIKFSLASSYLVNIHPFYDSAGNEIGDRRVYYAGQYKASDPEYILRYQIPACLILTFVALLPLILFGYPVMWFEKCIIHIKCIWYWYPADKVHIFLDTFQGCYKDNRRFFAGMYFAFRLTINVSYIVTDNWLQQFIVQQVVCTIFVFIIAFFWPYRAEYWYVNYVDLLILTNLSIVNALSLYLFVYAQINPYSQELPKWPFFVQYILVFFPLIYMVLFVLWSLLRHHHKRSLKKMVKWSSKKLRKWRFSRTTILSPSEAPTSPSQNHRNTLIVRNKDGISTTEVSILSHQTESDSYQVSSANSDDNLEAILVRAEKQNTYKSNSSKNSTHQTQKQQKVISSANNTTKDLGLTRTCTNTTSLIRHNDLSVSIRDSASNGNELVGRKVTPSYGSISTL